MEAMIYDYITEEKNGMQVQVDRYMARRLEGIVHQLRKKYCGEYKLQLLEEQGIRLQQPKRCKLRLKMGPDSGYKCISVVATTATRLKFVPASELEA